MRRIKVVTPASSIVSLTDTQISERSYASTPGLPRTAVPRDLSVEFWSCEKIDEHASI